MTLIKCSALVLLTQTNLLFGISNFHYMLFDTFTRSISSSLTFVPFLSLMCVMVPSGLEGTLFALFRYVSLSLCVRFSQTLSLLLSVSISRTCCYDDIKGTQDLKIYSMLVLRFPLCLFSRSLFHCPSTSHSHSHTHTHSLSLVLVVMMKSKEPKTKISHAHSLIRSLFHSTSLTLSFSLALFLSLPVLPVPV